MISVLFKSKFTEKGVENQVVGQVRGFTKAAHTVSKMFHENGIDETSTEVDEDGVTKIGFDQDGQRVGFSSIFKSSL